MNNQKPQVILLCAGKSSRLHPFSHNRHKSMIKIAGKPILEYTIAELKKCQLIDIIIVLGPTETGSKEINAYFSQGQKWGVSLRYVYEKKQLGMGQAILTASKVLNQKPFLVLNPNQINASQLIPSMLSLFNKEAGGVILTKETKTPEQYGIAILKNNKVLKIMEKPKLPIASTYQKIVGIYYLHSRFLDVLANTPVEDYQFENALDRYLTQFDLLACQTNEQTFSLKYPWHLFPLKNYILRQNTASISPQAQIHKTAIIEGNVTVEAEAKILENAIIKGPAYIGNRAVIGTNTLVRDFCDLEEAATIGCFTEVKNSLIGKNSSIHSGFIGDSLIGENCQIGASFITANKRLDRKTIASVSKNNKIDTNLKAFGAMIGDNCHIGIKTATMPGISISANSTIMPGETISRNR